MFITEGLDHLDMKNQVNDIVTIDEYAAKMGDDAEIITITFTVHSKLAAEDLVTWFERGYDWVLDASVSDGELDNGRWLVFVEMKRRSTAPERIINLLDDLETLTGFSLDDWQINLEGTMLSPEMSILKNEMILNPNEYKELRDTGQEEETEDEQSKDDDTKKDNTELNEVRQLAGIEPNTVYTNDEYIKNLKAMAGM